MIFSVVKNCSLTKDEIEFLKLSLKSSTLWNPVNVLYFDISKLINRYWINIEYHSQIQNLWINGMADFLYFSVVAWLTWYCS